MSYVIIISQQGGQEGFGGVYLLRIPQNFRTSIKMQKRDFTDQRVYWFTDSW